MDRKIFLSVSAVALIVLAVAILSPGGRQADSHPRLPWLIEPTADGSIRVFDITLGATTLGEAQRIIAAEGELTLFRSESEEHAAEAYFQRAALSGLRADIILSLDLADDQASAMYERGLRVSKLGSGTLKVDVSDVDRQQLLATAVSHITYIPATDLEPDLIRRQFGQPLQVLPEADGIEHWLYPDKGLDIAVNPDGKEVLQYLQPRHFEQAIAPLHALEQPGR